MKRMLQFVSMWFSEYHSVIHPINGVLLHYLNLKFVPIFLDLELISATNFFQLGRVWELHLVPTVDQLPDGENEGNSEPLSNSKP